MTNERTTDARRTANGRDVRRLPIGHVAAAGGAKVVLRRDDGQSAVPPARVQAADAARGAVATGDGYGSGRWGVSKATTINEQLAHLKLEENNLDERIRQIHRTRERLEVELRQLTSPFIVVWDHGKDDHETKYAIDRAEAEKRLRDALAFIREHASGTPYQLNQITADVYEFTYQPTFSKEPHSGSVFIANNPLFEAAQP